MRPVLGSTPESVTATAESCSRGMAPSSSAQLAAVRLASYAGANVRPPLTSLVTSACDQNAEKEEEVAVLVDDEVMVNVTSLAVGHPSVILLGLMIVSACPATAGPPLVQRGAGSVAKQVDEETAFPPAVVPNQWGAVLTSSLSMSMGKSKHAGPYPPAQVMQPVHSETERMSVSAPQHASALPPKAGVVMLARTGMSGHGNYPLAGAPLPPYAA